MNALAVSLLLSASLLFPPGEPGPEEEKVEGEANVAADIEGNWRIANGVSQDGAKYEGTVTVREEEGAYHLEWNTDAGTFPGLGLRYRNDLFVGWSTPESGIAVYQISENGVLEGDWCTPGLAGIGRERLAPMQNAVQIPGRYQVTGTNNDGSQYNGTMTIEQNGDVYQVSWGGNAGPATGVGMRVGDKLIVGYGAQTGLNGIIHYHFEGDAATGRWAIDDAEAIGTEDLAREAR